MNFRKYLAESSDQLDISIQSAGKYLTSNKRIEEFLHSETEVQHKTDGIKLTIIKVADNGDLGDWLFSYKGNILYREEYDYQPNTKVKTESIGSSQFKIAIDHFRKLGKTEIPINTELFIEYLMRKPTLSSNYTQHHKMVLIGSSKSQYTIKFGKLKTTNTGLDVDSREEIAKELKIDIPQVLFKGYMSSPQQFERGIIHPELKKLFNSHKNSMSWDNLELLLDDIKNLFLEVESKYGGKEEGVVLIQKGVMLKFQQEYQLDALARKQIKLRFANSSPEAESDYWAKINTKALELVSKVGTGTQNELPELLRNLSTELKYTKLEFCHEKKSEAIIKDDIQLTAKNLIVKNLRGNNNCLIIGKFRVLTTGHAAMINRAIKLFDDVVICIITSSDTKDTKDLRTEMLRETFPKLNIIHHNSGNLISIINKSPININAVYAGSDRVNEYIKQLSRSSVGVREMPRTSDDISASKIIDLINDESYFKTTTPKQIHSMYDKLKLAYEK